jgi:pyruvate/2-oxoacid:ferredoxin oxidoreductase alpha subunit
LAKELVKGNEAIVKGAILAGCRAYFGYPITPASEIAETAAYYLPRVGGTFLQAESEIGSINMVYGAAATGQRVMTASSSPGISLKMEGLSYCAGAELPCVVVNINRGGPGLGNIGPEQSDYFQMTKGGGHGSYRLIVLAPNSAQEMCDLTMKAFDLADKYRNPAAIMTDGFIGQMMEPVEFPEPVDYKPDKPWRVDATKDTVDNLVSSIILDHDDLEAHVNRLGAKYDTIEENEARCEEYRTDDADYLAVAFGIVSRVMMTAIDMAREEGIKVGLLRPITLWPFPKKPLAAWVGRAKAILVAELSRGQMIEDVKLAVSCKMPVDFHGRSGGNVPAPQELFDVIMKAGLVFRFLFPQRRPRQGQHPLLSGVRARQYSQADRRSAGRSGNPGSHGICQSGGLLGIRLLLFPCRQCPVGPRPGAGSGHRGQTRAPAFDRDFLPG